MEYRLESPPLSSLLGSRKVVSENNHCPLQIKWAVRYNRIYIRAGACTHLALVIYLFLPVCQMWPPTVGILVVSPCVPDVGSTHTLQWYFAFEIVVSSSNYVVLIFSLHKYFWCVVKRETSLAKVYSFDVPSFSSNVYYSWVYPSLGSMGWIIYDESERLNESLWLHGNCVHVRPSKYFLERGPFLLTYLKRFFLCQDS